MRSRFYSLKDIFGSGSRYALQSLHQNKNPKIYLEGRRLLLKLKNMKV